jgi:hypothetical protein
MRSKSRVLREYAVDFGCRRIHVLRRIGVVLLRGERFTAFPTARALHGVAAMASP